MFGSNLPVASNPAGAAYNPAIATKRKERDIMRLLMSDYAVQQSVENPYQFTVEFHGPKETPYQGGVWLVNVLLPDMYPYKSPSIGFLNKIFHPNIHEASGSVCLDVINQTWSPMFDLINVFEVFLPQLLSYPNPQSPLNPDAAALSIKEPEKYNDKIKEYVLKYAGKGGKQSSQELPENPNSMSNEKQSSAALLLASPQTQPTSDAMEIEDEDDKISLSNVSALSELSDVILMEECLQE